MDKEDAAMLLSHKRVEIPFAVKWRGREMTIPGEVNQRKTVGVQITYMWNQKMIQVNLALQNRNGLIVVEDRFMATKGEREEDR